MITHEYRSPYFNQNKNIDRHASFLMLLLPFSDKLFFTKWSFVANLHREILLAPFPQQHFFTSCLCVISWSFSQFSIFHQYYVWYGDLWSVIFDVTLVIALRHHAPHPCKMMNLIVKCCVPSECSNTQLFPHLISFRLASLFPEIQQY